LNSQATILSVRREPAAGFNVSGKSFFLWVDVSGTPTQISISFTGGGNLGLSTVIGQINTQANPTTGADVAFDDNGFLRLKSPNSGENSYLRLQTDPASSPTDVFFELGLFSETIARGGDITQAQHIDPNRQVSTPQQLSMAEGESVDSRVFNRMAMQLAINSDRTEGVVGRKRIPVRREIEVSYSPSTPEGFDLTGFTVYTGTATSPNSNALKKLFALLDAEGSELVKENVSSGPTDSNTSFSYDAPSGVQTVTSSTPIFSATDVTSETYVEPQDLTGGPSSLNGVTLKIVGFVSTTVVHIQPVDPATGQIVPINESGRSIEKVSINTQPYELDGVFDTSGGSRVEGIESVKEAATAPTRVEGNNRIVIVGATFQTNGVVVGDLVEWAGHGQFDPYSNNGEYRVSRVIDEETIEVVGPDWGAVFLNPNFSGGAGTVEVRTDGAFRKDPFLQLDNSEAVPANGQTVRLLFYELGDLRSATDDPQFFVGPGVRYDQEVDTLTQQALLKMAGPSVTSLNDIAFGHIRKDRNANIEQLDIFAEITQTWRDWMEARGFDGIAANDLNIKAVSPGTGPGGLITMRAGDSTDDEGGSVDIEGGDGAATFDGGIVTLTGGTAGSGGFGGNVNIVGGTGNGTAGSAGGVDIDGGSGGGAVNITGGTETVAGQPGGFAAIVGGSVSTDGPGGNAETRGGNAKGTDRAGGFATLAAGNSTGSAGSKAVIMAAVSGGASGTTVRFTELFAEFDGTTAVERIRFLKNVIMDTGLDVGFTTGTPAADQVRVGDVDFGLELLAGVPNAIINFDRANNEYLDYHRGNNEWNFFIGSGTSHLTINASGIRIPQAGSRVFISPVTESGFYLEGSSTGSVGTGFPRIRFDGSPTDELRYDRVNNAWEFLINSIPFLKIDPNGIRVEDADFGLEYNGTSDMRLLWDETNNDYFKYDRGNDWLSMFIGNTEITRWTDGSASQLSLAVHPATHDFGLDGSGTSPILRWDTGDELGYSKASNLLTLFLGVAGNLMMSWDGNNNKVTLGNTSHRQILEFHDATLDSPPTPAAGTGIIFARSIASAAATLWADSEGGSLSQISPHDPETGEWIFHDVDRKKGKGRIVRMERLVKALEEHLGISFTELYDVQY
jgi:hypothetical protein